MCSLYAQTQPTYAVDSSPHNHQSEAYPSLTQQHQRRDSFPHVQAGSSSLSNALDQTPIQPPQLDTSVVRNSTCLNEAQLALAMNLNRREANHAVECARQEVGGVPSRDIPEEVVEALNRSNARSSPTANSSVEAAMEVGVASAESETDRRASTDGRSRRSPTVQDNNPEAHATVEGLSSRGYAVSTPGAPVMGTDATVPPFPQQSSSSKAPLIAHAPAFPTASAAHIPPPAPNPVAGANMSTFITNNPHLARHIQYDGHIDYQVGGYLHEVYDGRSYLPDDANVPEAPPNARSGDALSIPRPHPLNPGHDYHMLLNPAGPMGDVTGTGGRGASDHP